MAINDVTEAFGDWLETVTGTRTPGTYVNGRWVAGTPVSLSFVGVVQNAEPEDLEVMPEGNRADDVIKIHSIFELIPQDKDTGYTGDLIDYDGNTYLVMNVADRKIGNYYKSLAAKQ